MIEPKERLESENDNTRGRQKNERREKSRKDIVAKLKDIQRQKQHSANRYSNYNKTYVSQTS